MAMRSANPALNKKTFASFQQAGISGKTMTIEGTVNKTALLLGCVLLTAYYSWSHPTTTSLWMIGLIGGLILALITIFKKEWAGITAPLYALFEGLFLGGISVMFEIRFPGIVMNAVILTFGTLFGLLLAYRSGLIKVTENFKLGIVAATGGIFFLYIASFIMGFFGMSMSFLHDSSPLSIGISFVIVIVAALNLVLDFDFIEHGASVGAPKFMEWYAAFGLMVTLIWLYIEILHLLSKLQGRGR
jgi:uncharacterized YccA/Bax inhibitor family protein